MGFGVMWGFGILSHLGLLMVLVSSGLALLALRGGRWRQGRGWWMVITIGCGLTNLLYTRRFHHEPDLQVLFALLLTALTAAAAWLPRGRLSRVLLGLAGVSLVGLTAAGMFWGSADIDVFTALQGAAEALIHGHNPYGPVFRYFVEVKPNLFRTVAPNFVWGHFPYGPIVPLLAVPGRLLGDVRVMSMVCVLATDDVDVDSIVAVRRLDRGDEFERGGVLRGIGDLPAEFAISTGHLFHGLFDVGIGSVLLWLGKDDGG